MTVIAVDTDVVSNEGQHPPATGGQVELLATGPLCRYAEDLLPSLRIMAGPNASMLKLDTKVNTKSSLAGVIHCRSLLFSILLLFVCMCPCLFLKHMF